MRTKIYVTFIDNINVELFLALIVPKLTEKTMSSSKNHGNVTSNNSTE